MSGIKALDEKFQLPRKKGEASAATISARIRGPQRTAASSVIAEKRVSMAYGSLKDCPSKLRPRRMRADVRCIIQPPIIQNTAADAIRTRKAPISRERGTCPSSRACSSRLDEAGSVRSRSLSSAIHDIQ